MTPARTPSDTRDDRPASSSNRAVAARATWAIADQVVSSATNFALGILVARSATPSELGAFSLIFWAYLILLAMARALSSQPLIVGASHASAAEWATATGAATGASLLLGMVGGAVLAAIGMLAEPTGTPAIVMGIGMAGLLVQDTFRYALIAQGRAWGAIASDLAWAIVMATLVLRSEAAGDSLSVTAATVIWVVGALVGALVAAVVSRVIPRMRGTLGWARLNRSLIPGFVIAGLAETAIITVRQFALAALAGLEVVGALRASQLVLSPITVAHQGVSFIAAPEASRIRRHAPWRFVPWLTNLSLSLAVGAALAGLAIINMPDAVGEALLGANWAVAKPILPPQAIFMVLLVAANGPGAGLLVLGAATRLARLTIWTKILGTGLVLAGGLLAAAAGAAWATVLEQSINLGALTRSFRGALRQESSGVTEPTEDAS